MEFIPADPCSSRLQNDSIALAEIHEPIVAKCGIELPDFDEFNVYDVDAQQIKKHVNIEHIKCVVTAITIAVADNPDALDWILYQTQLTKSIAALVLCKYHVNQSMYVDENFR